MAVQPTLCVGSLQQAQGVGGVELKYHGMVDVVVKTVRHEGFFGLYKVRCSAAVRFSGSLPVQ